MKEIQKKNVSIPFGQKGENLQAILTLSSAAKGIVIFAHGSGSGRLSPRNQYVANYLAKEGLASLLIDLLTPAEEAIDLETRQFRFDIPLLAQRLRAATEWVGQFKETKILSIGYFGSSTGAAAALIAAAQLGNAVQAVVSRGGRPDLANAFLDQVTAPTLLIVGGNDFGVIELNQEAFALLKSKKKLEIVPRATHLFEEEGALEEVARLAANWFNENLE